jgi:hypothetical protein
MTERRCRVTISDVLGKERSIDVTASSLFEAVARALLAIRGPGSNAASPDGFKTVRVTVQTTSVYEVRLKNFASWLNRQGRSPKEVMDRKKIRRILGLSA